jgi:aspartokinase
LETIAVYREERVKVYGISEKPGLCLGVLHFPSDRLVECESWIKDLDKFELVTFHSAKQDKAVLHFLVDQSRKSNLENRVKTLLDGDTKAQFSVQSPVDLIYLHGPHFQDRDGIAEVAFTALKKHDLEILVVGCSGTSMYIVTPENLGHTATRILTETFLIPMSN